MARRHRPPGYDKYYTDAACATCGGYTGVEYAWRFGEGDPGVLCDRCQGVNDRRAHQARKHPQNHTRHVFCSQCKTHMRDVYACPDNRDLYDVCVACKALKQ